MSEILCHRILYQTQVYQIVLVFCISILSRSTDLRGLVEEGQTTVVFLGQMNLPGIWPEVKEVK